MAPQFYTSFWSFGDFRVEQHCSPKWEEERKIIGVHQSTESLEDDMSFEGTSRNPLLLCNSSELLLGSILEYRDNTA